MIFYKRPLPFRLISFDLDDTLYDNAPIMARAEHEFADFLCDRYGLDPYARDPLYWKIVKRTLCEEDASLLNDVTDLRALGLIRGFEILRRPLEGGLEEAYALTDHFVKIRSDFEVPLAARDLLSILKRHYPLAAVSNGNVDLQAIGLEGYFDYDLRPSRCGHRRKPHADLFHRLSSLTGVPVREILHVGDDPVTDVQGAVDAGVQCAFLMGGYVGNVMPFERLTRVPTLGLDSLLELLNFTEYNLRQVKLPLRA